VQRPGRQVRVLHPGVAAEPAVRRDHVRGVAGQEDPSVLMPVSVSTAVTPSASCSSWVHSVW
jgi:hypothetical protein